MLEELFTVFRAVSVPRVTRGAPESCEAAPTGDHKEKAPRSPHGVWGETKRRSLGEVTARTLPPLLYRCPTPFGLNVFN